MDTAQQVADTRSIVESNVKAHVPNITSESKKNVIDSAVKIEDRIAARTAQAPDAKDVKIQVNKPSNVKTTGKLIMRSNVRNLDIGRAYCSDIPFLCSKAATCCWTRVKW